MQMHANDEEKQTDNNNKQISPSLTDYLIRLNKQNNNIKEKPDPVKLFRPINF